MSIPIRISVFERGISGAPSTSLRANLHEQITSYAHAISDQYGFETMTVTLTTTLEDATDWLTNGLLRSAVATGPDGGVIWEGFLNSAEMRAGQETRGLSLDNMANRIKCKYTGISGGPGTSTTMQDTRSQALYGVRDLIVGLNNTTATGAAAKATQVLALMKYPRATGSIGVATGGGGDVSVTLNFVGWYAKLGWTVTSNTSTTNTLISTQLATLIATQTYLLSSSAGITTSAISDTEYIEADTTYQDKIESLLAQDNYAWGVYEDRKFFAQPCADLTPSTIDYLRSLGEGVVRDTSGALVNAWDIRPNNMYAVKELLDLNPSDIAPDAGGTSYISRASCSVSRDTISLSLEGRTGDTIDRIVARVR